jgi:hypothetical protein
VLIHLLALDCRPSPHIEPILDRIRQAGFMAEIVRVPYEFQAAATR